MRFIPQMFVCLLVVCFLGPPPRHMEVSRLGVKLQLQLLAYSTATATWDPSCICDLHHSSRQCWILKPLSEVRDRTNILMDTSWVRNPLSHNRNSEAFYEVLFLMSQRVREAWELNKRQGRQKKKKKKIHEV